jgi:cytosine/adenosine deaminase-related metal-dependent hydrolase
MNAPREPNPKPFNSLPTESGPLVILGKIVPMDGSVIEDGAVYCRSGRIECVQGRHDPTPEGFSDAVRLETRGVVYPGLIDLHSHLSYNVLPLWQPPRKYGDRYEWRRDPAYQREVAAPAKALVEKGLSPAIVRYVETKLLVGGTTSAQGMSTRGSPEYYRGMVRNLEQSGDPALPSILSELEDPSVMKPEENTATTQTLNAGGRVFHHLAEGRNQNAQQAYTDVCALRWPGPNYVGIHCVGLAGADFAAFARTGAKAVWSPTSNGLLYGATVEFGALFSAGSSWGLGCDWSPSGTKNLLGEIKVALLAAADAGVDLSYRALAEAVTIGAARIAGWGHAVGKVSPDYYADLLVLEDRTPDPYENLVRAHEGNVRLVTISGVPRYGDEALMMQTGIPPEKLEPRTVSRRARRFHYEHPDALPAMNALSLATAVEHLETAMGDLTRPVPPSPLFRLLGSEKALPMLDLEMDAWPEKPLTIPERMKFLAETGAPPPSPPPALPPLTAVPLDKLTVLDDPDFFDRIEAVTHAPAYLRRLRSFYGA